jgi:hypothetical protein
VTNSNSRILGIVARFTALVIEKDSLIYSHNHHVEQLMLRINILFETHPKKNVFILKRVPLLITAHVEHVY